MTEDDKRAILKAANALLCTPPAEPAMPRTRGVAVWPLKCRTLSVLPHEAAAAQADAIKAGCHGAVFDKQGNLTLSSPSQRRRYFNHLVKTRPSMREHVDRCSYGGRL